MAQYLQNLWWSCYDDDIFTHQAISENKALLWKDRWINHNTLREQFLNLYPMEALKSYYIIERREGGVFKWDWRTLPNSDLAKQELVNLNSMLCGYNVLHRHAKIWCKLNLDGRVLLV